MRLSLVVVESMDHSRDMVEDSPADERFRIRLDGSSLYRDGGSHVLGDCISERYEQSGQSQEAEAVRLDVVELQVIRLEMRLGRWAEP